MARIVTVGVTRVSVIMPEEELSKDFDAYSRTPWMRFAVNGGAYQVANAVAALGDEPRLCTTVGSDEHGELIRAKLRRAGLDSRGVTTARRSERSAVFVRSSDGSGRVSRCSAAGEAAGYPMERFIERAVGADLVVISSNPFGRQFLDLAKNKLRLPIATDLHAARDDEDFSRQPWLECADIIFRSHEGLSRTPRQWIADVLRKHPGCSIAAVGRGKKGCTMGLRDGRLVHVAAAGNLRPVVSTDGAGDALLAAFLHGWLMTGEPVEALESAVVFAGWKIGEESADEGFLTADELAAMRQLHPVQTRVSTWK